MRALPFGLGVFGLGIVIALWLTNCSGPRPEVSAYVVDAPDQPNDPYRVTASIRNDGPGRGEIRVTFKLRDPTTQRAYADEKTVEIRRSETINVVGEIHAQPSAYEAEVEAEYPVR